MDIGLSQEATLLAYRWKLCYLFDKVMEYCRPYVTKQITFLFRYFGYGARIVHLCLRTHLFTVELLSAVVMVSCPSAKVPEFSSRLSQLKKRTFLDLLILRDDFGNHQLELIVAIIQGVY